MNDHICGHGRRELGPCPVCGCVERHDDGPLKWGQLFQNLDAIRESPTAVQYRAMRATPDELARLRASGWPFCTSCGYPISAHRAMSWTDGCTVVVQHPRYLGTLQS